MVTGAGGGGGVTGPNVAGAGGAGGGVVGAGVVVVAASVHWQTNLNSSALHLNPLTFPPSSTDMQRSGDGLHSMLFGKLWPLNVFDGSLSL